MNAEIKNAVERTDREAQYDAGAKRLLGNKNILAHILVKTVGEFKGMNPKEVVPLIEGEPFIGSGPVGPGLTNAVKEKDGQRVVGFNSENAEINEGMIRFDIVFYVRMKDGISQIIINVEAQKDEAEDYDILNRAIFYASRLISSQKERDFVGTKYNDIRRVFSIWVCMNMDEGIMDYVHLTRDKLLGDYPWKGKLDLFNIVMIGLAKELPEHDEMYDLHRLLGALLSGNLSVDEKLDIIEKEYDIPTEDGLGKDVGAMCNLSLGIREEGIAIGEERGIAIGEARGKERGIAIGEARGKAIGEAIGEARGKAIGEAKIIRTMYNNGFTPGQIADVTNKTLDEVRAILEGEDVDLS